MIRQRFRGQRFQPNRFSRRPPVTSQSEVVRAIAATKLLKQQDVEREPEVFVAKHAFTDFPVVPQLQQNIVDMGYTTPTPIQDQAIMPILEGRDFIGIANTGTGKTAAFLIPLIQKVAKNHDEKVIILTPTRELAVQIYDVMKSLSKGSGMRAVLCTGGTNMEPQRRGLSGHYNFVIGTPGRIKDLVQRNMINLSTFRSVVLDEADRMVDIGFIRDIKFFISLLPNERQSLFFSATITDKVKEIVSAFVKDPITISVKQQDTAATIAQDIVQVVDKQKKVDQLHDLLNQEGFDKVLIFGRTKWGIQKLTNELVSRGFKAGAIHGNKRQSQRQNILDQFKRSEITILLATDVASRGLDIEDVSHVINYDMPATYEDYVHRIGRTGRANKQGIALTFVD